MFWKPLGRAVLMAAVGTLLIVGLLSCEQGSYFDSSTKQIKSDYVSRLEATGTDLRIYEFTPRSAPHIQCVFVAGERKGGLQCWGKGILNPELGEFLLDPNDIYYTQE